MGEVVAFFNQARFSCNKAKSIVGLAFIGGLDHFARLDDLAAEFTLQARHHHFLGVAEFGGGNVLVDRFREQG